MLNIDEDKLKLLLTNKKSKLERPKYSGVGEIISAISMILTLCLSDFSQLKIINPQYFKIGAWLLSLSILAFGIITFIKSVAKPYSIDNLYHEIMDLDPIIEHPFNIVLIKNSRESGKYLLFRSKRWNCWLFPNYRCLNGQYNQNLETEHIRECLNRDLDISGNIDIEYLGNKISHKYSFADKIDKKYNFHYFQITNITINSRKNRQFSFNGKKYSWKTLDQMYSNKNIVKKNYDVLDFVRNSCDIS